MPTVTTNVRHQVLAGIETALKTINALTGYNHTPHLAEDYKTALDSVSSATLYTKVGRELFSEPAVSGRQQVSLEVLIFGLVKKTDSTINEDLNGLIQDVRNAVAGARSTIHGNTGATFMGFDEAETDEGALSQDGKGFFVQPVTFTYVAGTTW